MAHPIVRCTRHGSAAPGRQYGAAAARRHPREVAHAAARAPALELRGVTYSWRAEPGACAAAVRALCGIDLAVRAGEVVAVAGSAGAGKTTLLLCASGRVRPEAGRVLGDAAGHACYVGGGAWLCQATKAVERGARALLLDVLDAPGFASPRAVAALAGSAAAAGLAVVVVSRDPAVLPAFATRLVTLAAGRVVASVEPLALLSRFVARRPRTP